jgi:hypothetical protein
MANPISQENLAEDVHQSDCPPTAQPDRPRMNFGSILVANTADYASFAGFTNS